MEPTELVSRQSVTALAIAEEEWSVERIVAQAQKIQQCMSAVMKDGEHYGIIPGTSRKDERGKELAKPTLLKPGAEKLCLMFRLKPSYVVIDKVETDARISFTIRCLLSHIGSGNEIAEGLGSCNSREAKYTRAAPRKCPNCGKETIIKGKEEYGGGWLCFAKKGGCGHKWPTGAPEIEKQETGIADPSDLHNTILKMACKRALVAAVLNGTAASDFFTQDLEDLSEKAAEYTPPVPPSAPVGPNVPVPNKNGRGAWPKAVSEHHTVTATREIDEAYARTVNDGAAPSDLEVDLQRSIDDVTVEVIDHVTGEVTRQPKMNKAQSKKLHALVNQLRIDDKAYRAGLMKYYKVNTSTLLTKAQATDMIDRLEISKARVPADMLPPDPPEDRGDVPTPEEMAQEPGGSDAELF